uniref:Uncharacterized protein n=1 Tax=Astatotilapia calliptera TaxID=8154 RepID=A0A3P8NTW9_ASTCA
MLPLNLLVVVLLAALTVFLLFYLHSSNIFHTQKDGKEPPGPTPLPLIGNLLQLDLKRIYLTLVNVTGSYSKSKSKSTLLSILPHVQDIQRIEIALLSIPR